MNGGLDARHQEDGGEEQPGEQAGPRFLDTEVDELRQKSAQTCQLQAAVGLKQAAVDAEYARRLDRQDAYSTVHSFFNSAQTLMIACTIRELVGLSLAPSEPEIMSCETSLLSETTFSVATRSP